MTLFEFIGLDINQQAEYVWQGKHVDTRHEGDFEILLYNVGDFYAEVFYDNNIREITHIKGFKAISNLAPYIKLPK